MISTDLAVWLGAFFTISIFSYPLYKDNLFFRFAERSLVGVSTGYFVTQAINQILKVSVRPAIAGQWHMIIPALIGLLLYTRYVRGFEHGSKWAVSVLMGVGLTIAVLGNVSSKIIALVSATMIAPTSIDNIITIVLVFSVLVYFLFSFEHTGPLGWFAKIGRYGMMATFGVNFGNYVLMRLTLVLNRMMFLLFDVLGLG